MIYNYCFTFHFSMGVKWRCNICDKERSSKQIIENHIKKLHPTSELNSKQYTRVVVVNSEGDLANKKKKPEKKKTAYASFSGLKNIFSDIKLTQNYTLYPAKMKINTEPAVHSDIEIGSEQITSKGSEKERDSNHDTCDVNIIPQLSSFISENLDMSLPVPDVAGNNIVTVSVLAEHPTRPSVPPVTTSINLGVTKPPVPTGTTRHSIITVTTPTIRTQPGTIPPIHVVTRSPTQTTLRHPIPTGTRPKIRFGTRLQMRFGTRPQIQPSTGPQIQSSIRPPVPIGIRPSITTVTRPPFITLPKPSTHVVSRPPILASTRPPIPTSNSFPIPMNTRPPIPFNTRPPTPNPECPPPTMSITMTPFSLLSPADKALLCRGDFKVPYKTRGS